jgi:hypothetical protein
MRLLPEGSYKRMRKRSNDNGNLSYTAYSRRIALVDMSDFSFKN